MRSVVIESPSAIHVREVPDPIRGAGDAIVRVRRVTICGSDLKIAQGMMTGIEYPLVPGHEWVGDVIEASGSYKSLIGKTVVADSLESCGVCKHCMSGLPNLCEALLEPGLSRPGAFADFMAVRASNLFSVDAAVPDSEAVLIEPLAVALYALQRVPVSPGETVAILGGGGIGQLIARSIGVMTGAQIVVVDPHQARRTAAELTQNCRSLSAGSHLVERWEAMGIPFPDVVFDATGDTGALQQAIDLVRPGGRIGVVGYSGPRTAKIEPSLIMAKLLTITGVLSPTGKCSEAVELVNSGRISLAGIVSHCFPLEGFAEALDCARTRSDGAIRVSVAP